MHVLVNQETTKDQCGVLEIILNQNMIIVLIIKIGIHQLNMNAKIQLKMLDCLNFLLFQNMKLKGIKRMKNCKDCALLILKMKLENVLILICSMKELVLKQT